MVILYHRGGADRRSAGEASQQSYSNGLPGWNSGLGGRSNGGSREANRRRFDTPRTLFNASGRTLGRQLPVYIGSRTGPTAMRRRKAPTPTRVGTVCIVSSLHEDNQE